MTTLARKALAAAVALAAAAPGPLFAQVARVSLSAGVPLSPAPVVSRVPAAPSLLTAPLLAPAALRPALAAPSVSPAPAAAAAAAVPAAKALPVLEAVALQAVRLADPKSGAGESKASAGSSFDGASDGSSSDGGGPGGPSKAAFLARVRAEIPPGTVLEWTKVGEIGGSLGLDADQTGAIAASMIEDGHLAVRDNKDAVFHSFRSRVDAGRGDAADVLALEAIRLFNVDAPASIARAAAKADLAVAALEKSATPDPARLAEAKALRGNAMLELFTGMLSAHREWLQENADTPKLAAREIEAGNLLAWLKTATWRTGDAPLMPERVHKSLVAMIGTLNPQAEDGGTNPGEIADGYIAALDLLEKYDRRDFLFPGASKTAPGTPAEPARVTAFIAAMKRLDNGPGDTWSREDLTRAGRSLGLAAGEIQGVLAALAGDGEALIMSNGAVVWFDFREQAFDDADGPWEIHSEAIDAIKLANAPDARSRLRAVAKLDAAYADYLKLGKRLGRSSGAVSQASIALADAKLEALEAALRLREKELAEKPGPRLDAVRGGLDVLSGAWYAGERLQRFTSAQTAALMKAVIVARLNHAAGDDAEAGRGADLTLEFMAAIKAGGGSPRIPGRPGGRDTGDGGKTGGPLSSKAALEAKLKELGAPGAVRETALSEYDKLSRLDPRDSEAQKLKTYVEWLLALPWSVRSEDASDLAAARSVLDAEHAGLERVKERVLEFLAVRKKTGSKKGAIIAFTGPPGTGKTSIAAAIAQALGRKFVRLSLGGVHDETVLRGHGRTYVGSMPGEVMRQMKSAGTINPVMLLDEADKLGRASNMGDPSAALLEILDPEQNSTFRDRYLDVAYDLSEVLFIVTANDLAAIPGPLRDRMEIIEFDGYTTLDKIEIAEKHVVAQKREAAGLAPNEAALTRGAIRRIVEGYTMEAGVRGLREKIGTVMRKISAWTETRGEPAPAVVDEGDVARYLGVERYSPRETAKNGVGVATGLSVGAHGGSTLNVEVSAEPGSGRLILRKQFGPDIADSAMNALKFVKVHAAELGLAGFDFSKVDVDINITPAGKVDGPSAGSLMVTAIVSALTGRPVADGVAMTGEITMRGDVLPIGGLKQKVMAAHRMGYKEVIFPAANLKDLESIPKEVRDGIKLTPARTYAEIHPAALAP